MITKEYYCDLDRYIFFGMAEEGIYKDFKVYNDEDKNDFDPNPDKVKLVKQLLDKAMNDQHAKMGKIPKVVFVAEYSDDMQQLQNIYIKEIDDSSTEHR